MNKIFTSSEFEQARRQCRAVRDIRLPKVSPKLGTPQKAVGSLFYHQVHRFHSVTVCAALELNTALMLPRLPLYSNNRDRCASGGFGGFACSMATSET